MTRYGAIIAALLLILNIAACSKSTNTLDFPKTPADRLPSFTAVCQKIDGIYILEENQPERLIARNGSYARLSPDCTMIAFVREKAIWAMHVNGGNEKKLADASEPRALCWHPDGISVLYTDGASVKQAFLSGDPAVTVLQGQKLLEIDVSPDGKSIIGTVKALTGYNVEVFTLPDGKSRKLANGCSASFSPDGKYATINDNSHTILRIVEVETGKTVKELSAHGGIRLDNQFWTNHPDWIAGISEGETMDIFLYDLRNNKVIRVTETGGFDRPDFFFK